VNGAGGKPRSHYGRPTNETVADLAAVQRDDDMLNALAAGGRIADAERETLLAILDSKTVQAADPADRENLLRALLSAWQQEVCPDDQPIPDLVDTDRALFTLRKSRRAYRRWWRRALRFATRGRWK
jgi:hypothetical protein